MKKNKTLIWKILGAGLALAGTGIFAISCAQPVQEQTPKKENKQETTPTTPKAIANWDTNIVITYGSANDGFKKKDPKTQKSPHDIFLENLERKFNELKNADPNLRVNADVKFNTAENFDEESMKNSLLSDDVDNDLSIIGYKSIDDKIDKTNLDKYPHYVGNTETLAFKWTVEDNANYVDGSDNDPLVKGAKENNKVWFDNNGEFPQWYTIEDELKWDGSKYAAFYDDTNRLTQFYRGAIYISGTDEELQAIENAWKTKNWDEFSKYGIIYKNTTSLGKYRLQAHLLAQHFNLTPLEVNTYFTEQKNKDNKKVSLGKFSTQLGKKDSLGHTFHIAFGDEGEMNWNRSTNDKDDKFKPTDPNAKIRVLTLTGPSPYNAVFSRQGLPKAESQLIMKALESLSIDENQLGIYTGFNKFISGDDNMFKTYIDIYNGNTIDTKNK
ncbi:ABC transporter thiamine pyrophosphate-binding lipoprotein p37/Cypl [Mycoplasma miroungirhinis]|uniref:ABC transporter substrate-binding protein n=1 Tax=Mycoplasma miroungirhinis TaxID=754516 RepID=A0A6M4JDI4_9MOLU|nr:ABC transporter substrate-binding protein [Mycoplasma miroungirhinis]QJR44385.1 ABC transporter substrate-binding protein [Mycoplasma miroungirhinis]